MEFFCPEAGKFSQGFSFCLGCPNGFIVYVGKVPDMERVQSSYLEGSPENILHQECAKVSDVCRSINGGAATVETKLFSVFSF
jgi:hypothetical protein